MAKKPILFLVATSCKDPTREEEFNRWYNQTHIPEIKQRVPGVKGATRYQLVDQAEGQPKYLAVYELEDEAAWQSFNTLRAKQRSGEAAPFKPGPPMTLAWALTYKPIGP